MNMNTSLIQSTYRRNANGFRSLFVNYTRTISDGIVKANIVDHLLGTSVADLTVMGADSNGIEIKLPKVVSGLFTLNIQDGTKAISRRFMVQ